MLDVLCFECGGRAEHNHHVVPRILGGTKTVPLCVGCHGLVHDRAHMSTKRLTRVALAAKRARGERTGGVPIGYQLASDGRTLEPDVVEQHTIARVRELRAEGLTFRAIAECLTAEGAPARGVRWHPTTIHRMVGKDV